MDELKKEFKEMAKAKGLDMAEDALKELLELALEMLPKLAAKTDNKIDDMVVPLLAMIKPQLLVMIDKLDGEEG